MGTESEIQRDCEAGERIPLITSEEYGIYYVSYIDDDRKSELSLEIEKKKDGWYVTRINWDKDNVFMELSSMRTKSNI